MPKNDASSKSERNEKSRKEPGRRYEAEALELQSLRILVAPRPEDDLTDEELGDVVQGKKGHSSALIQHLIEHIKSL